MWLQLVHNAVPVLLYLLRGVDGKLLVGVYRYNHIANVCLAENKDKYVIS